jgi:hypothetical protein
VLALALAAMAAVAMRAEAATLAELAAAIDRVATEPDGDRVVVGHISQTLATSAETLRADRATLTAEVERSKEMIEQRSEDKGPPSGRPAARQTGGGGSGRGGRRR